MIEILIVEDNAAYLDTLKEMIEATDDMTLHTAWRSAESAVNALCHGDFPSEALLLLDGLGAQPQPVEPLYVEGPPIQPPKAK